jgi:hypothetical protein
VATEEVATEEVATEEVADSKEEEKDESDDEWPDCSDGEDDAAADTSFSALAGSCKYHSSRYLYPPHEDMSVSSLR